MGFRGQHSLQRLFYNQYCGFYYYFNTIFKADSFYFTEKELTWLSMKIIEKLKAVGKIPIDFVKSKSGI